VFGFLMLVVVILVITCAEISIVLCYFQLCAEDYNWWWRSFLTSGSSAIYLFGYGILYFITKVGVVCLRCVAWLQWLLMCDDGAVKCVPPPR
jgi:transmembrane 9 superfamily protein 2/4